jgi:hypothetical protein
LPEEASLSPSVSFDELELFHYKFYGLTLKILIACHDYSITLFCSFCLHIFHSSNSDVIDINPDVINHAIPVTLFQLLIGKKTNHSLTKQAHRHAIPDQVITKAQT